jgi:hypothetical protein
VKSAGNGACARMGTASRAMIASTPKISFWPDVSNSPENYGYLLVC